MQSALAGLSLLVLGDSHWAAQSNLAGTLQDQLIQRGATVNSFAACGAPASVWLSARVASCGATQRLQRGKVEGRVGVAAPVTPIDELVRRHRPNLIVVSMGDSMAGYMAPRTPADSIKEDAMTLTSHIRRLGIPCIWIGPSWGSEGGPFLKTFARVQEVNAILAQSVAPCVYVDSLRLSRPGEWQTYDGTHYTVEGYRAYGTALAQQIMQIPEVRAAAQKR
ncbi:MAG TPA: SGNH/GDSL hydrolase family protein [Roseomonas sp.]